MTTRRRFLHDSSLLAAGAFLVPAGSLAGPVPGRAISLDQIRFGAFAANVGTAFRVLQDQGPAIGLELLEAKARRPTSALEAAAPDAGNEKFSLLFAGLPSQPLAQDTYVFGHSVLGWFAMFIVPVPTLRLDYRLYEAIFNRPAVRTQPAGTHERATRNQ